MLILLSAILLQVLPAQSAEKLPSNYSLFAGTGVGYSLPGPIRFRTYSVEVGTYGPALGLTKVFFLNSLYGQLGLALGVLGRADLGVIAAMGLQQDLLWILGARGEVFTYVGSRGLAYSGATIGLTLNF